MLKDKLKFVIINENFVFFLLGVHLITNSWKGLKAGS